MSLTIVATPIGNWDDISIRAISALKEAEIVIGEDQRVASTFLKKIKIENKEIYILNEHSKKEDILELLEFCKAKTVCLISDCGTPVFCDPGAALIFECRKAGILVKSIPGASSLMTLLSLSSKKLSQFHFVGLLPQEKLERNLELKRLSQTRTSMVIMDTPYRLNQTLDDLNSIFSNRLALLGIDLTSESEEVYENTIQELCKKIPKSKREFILLIY